MQCKRRGHIDAIEVVGDRWVGDRILVSFVANAADRDNRLEALVLGDIYPGCDCAEVNKRVQLPIFHVLRAECSDGLRQILQAFGSLLRGD